LFILAAFGLLAMYVSTGLGREYLAETAPAVLGMLDGALGALLVEPFGRKVAVNAILVIGALLAFWSMVSGRGQAGRQQHYSTW
jgi:hypothetical protein